MKLSNVQKQMGFTAIELMVVLIVTIAALAAGGQALNDYTDGMVQQSASDHAKSVSDAAVRYIKDNNAAVLAVATPTTPATITVPMLQGAGYLPAAFTAVNPYNQTYSILALEPTAGQLQTLIVTSGGETISELGIRRIAQQVGARGGFISSTNTANAVGSYSGWTMPLASYGVSPGAGHLAVALFFQDGSLVSDYVYRNAVAGHPELNTMNTPLIMASIQTNGAACTTNGSIARDADGAVLSCVSAVWKTQGSSFWQDPVANIASLPVCNAAAAWQTRVVQTPTIGTGPRPYTCDGTLWQPLSVDDSGNLRLDGGTLVSGGASSNYGALTVRGAKNGWGGINFKDGAGVNLGTVMMNGTYAGFYNAADSGWSYYVDNSGNSHQAGNAEAGTLQVNTAVAEGSACSPDGKIAKSSTTSGLILSCQSGVWRRFGSTIQMYQCPRDYSTGAGAWATWGCIGQVSAQNYCQNFAWGAGYVTRACTPI